MLKDIEAVIFDLDGTLIDSMWIWEKIDREYLETRGIAVPENLKDEISHLSFDQVAIYFRDKFNIQESLEAIHQTWNDMAILEYSNNARLKKGADKFLAHLKNLRLKIGLATSNNGMLLETALVKNNIYRYFDAITTTGEVKNGKNEPDVYLLCAERLGVAPEKCLVFEDLPIAVKGAKAAGMKVIAVHDPFSAHAKEEMTTLADKYIMDYDEIFKDDESNASF